MKCTYCSAEIPRGTGIMYVHRDGEIAHYCSNRCWNFHVKMRRKVSSKIIAQRSGKAKAAQKK